MRSQKATVLTFLAALLTTLMIMPTAAMGQESKKPQTSTEKADAAPLAPDLAELAPIASELTQRLTALEKKIAAFADFSAAKDNFAKIRENLQGLAERLEASKTAKTYDFNKFIDLKAEIQRESGSLEEIVKPLTEALKELESAKKEWENEKRQWAEWRSSLPKDAALSTVQPAFASAQKTIAKALSHISKRLQRLLMVQQEAAEIESRIYSLTSEVDATLAVARSEFLRKVTPPMFSSGYFSQFNQELLGEFRKGLTAVSWPGRQFFKQEKWVIFVQVLLALAITIGIRRFRPHLEKMEQWQFLVNRPFAVGAFIGVTIATTAYESLPPLWALVLLTVIGIAAARLAPAFMTKPWGTWLFYGLALIVIDTFFLPYVGMPLPLFRLFIFFVALIGSSLCLWRSLVSARRQDSLLYTWTLRLSGLILAVVLVAEVFGYSDFAYYLFEASLKTIYIVLLAWMLKVMARGLLELAVRSSFFQQIQLVRDKTALVIGRLVLLINLGIVFFLSCYILETWKIFPSPLAAMQEILSLGFTVGSMRITVGLALTALACLYGSVLASMTVQVVLSETVFSQRQLEPGVRISISRLLHYVFVLVGFLLALAVLGVEFRNITIIGGALGVGIGFGLQGIVNNFVSGLILLFERPIKIGDYVTIGNQWGEIKHMGMRATVVQIFDRSEIVVPNSELVSNQVTNWTLSDRFVRLIISVGVAYGSDVTLVMETLMECAMANSKVMRMPEPQVFFRKFGESALDFELRVWISNVDDRRQTESDLHRDIDQKFRQAGIEIAFPQRDLHVRSVEESPSDALSPLPDQRPDLVVVASKETKEEK